MNRIRVVSISHPTIMRGSEGRRFELLTEFETTMLVTASLGGMAARAGVRRVSVPTRGRGRGLRFPSLATALNLLDPHIVHLQADPDTSLARQVARLRGKHGRFGLVLETEADMGIVTAWPLSPSLLSRQVLVRTGALITRSAMALACMRRCGFRGIGVVAGSGQEPTALPDRAGSRRLLQLGADCGLVIGWVGGQSGLYELVASLAACEAPVYLVAAAAGSDKHDLVDRADALEILDRVRITPDEMSLEDQGRARICDHPTMASAIDILVVTPPRHKADRMAAIKDVEFAQTHGIPVICQDRSPLAEIIGPGGWAAPLGDPALMARMLTTLSTRPDLVAQAAAAALGHATRRHSPEAAAADLARAINAAAATIGFGRSTGEARTALGDLRMAFESEPSRT